MKKIISFVGILTYVAGICLQLYSVFIKYIKYVNNDNDIKQFMECSDIPQITYFAGLFMIALGILVQNKREYRIKMYNSIPYLFVLCTITIYFSGLK